MSEGLSQMEIIPTEILKCRAQRLRDELQTLEKYLYSQIQTQASSDALFHFGYIQATLLDVVSSYEKQVQEQGDA